MIILFFKSLNEITDIILRNKLPYKTKYLIKDLIYD